MRLVTPQLVYIYTPTVLLDYGYIVQVCILILRIYDPMCALALGYDPSYTPCKHGHGWLLATAGSPLPIWTSTSELTANRCIRKEKRNHRITVTGANNSASSDPDLTSNCRSFRVSVQGPCLKFLCGAQCMIAHASGGHAWRLLFTSGSRVSIKRSRPRPQSIGSRIAC